MKQVQEQAVQELRNQYLTCTTPIACVSLSFKGEHDIAAIARRVGREEVEGVLALHLMALSKYLNLKQGITQDQVDIVVRTLMNDEEYKHLNMADFNLIITRIKENRYGDFYGSFTGSKFLEICDQYNRERLMAIERYRQQECWGHRSKTEGMANESIINLVKNMHMRRISAIEEDKKRKEAHAKRQAYVEQERERIANEARRISIEERIPYDDAWNKVMLKGINTETNTNN